MIQDILVKENMVFRSLHQTLNKDDNIVEIKETFREAKNFELNPPRPKKVHTFIFWHKNILNLFNEHQALFDDYPYFKINITQAKVMPYITYKLKDKALVETDDFKAFKKKYNQFYGNDLENPVDKKSRSQCYRLKNTIDLIDLKTDEDVNKWYEETFKDVLNIQ